MPRLLILLAALACAACVKPRGTDEPKTSELVPHYTRSLSGGTIICDAWFSLESDPLNAITLETDAIMTCNGSLMLPTGPFFSGGTPYTPAKEVSISLIRRIDGTTLTDTQIFY